jgi:hypothetical protein
MQKQGATKIMSDLDSALWKRITQIVQKENRSFSYYDFVPKFKVDGQSYSIVHGTFRNKVSDMLKAGKIQLVRYSPQAFYTLKGQEFTDPMTGYHTGSSHLFITDRDIDISQMTQSIGLFRTFPLEEDHYMIFA